MILKLWLTIFFNSMIPSSTSCMIDVGYVGSVSNVCFSQYGFRFVEFFRPIEIIWIRMCILLWVFLCMPIQNFWQERTTNPLSSFTTSVNLSWVTPINFLDSAIMFVYEECFCGSDIP